MSSQAPQPTPIRRSGNSLKRSALPAGVFLALGVVCFLNGWTVFGSLSALLAIISLLAARLSSYEGECPTCGDRMEGITKIALSRCCHCANYATPRDGRLYPLREDYVAPEPLLALLLPPGRSFRMPPVCCACGDPASHEERVGFSTPVGQGIVSTQALHQSVDVPYCDQHKQAALLSFASSSAAGVARGTLELKVRSYRFYRAFLDLNGRDRSQGGSG